MRRSVSSLGLSLCLALAVTLVGLAGPARTNAATDSVLLIHGYRGSPAGFWELEAYLRDQGRTVASIQLATQDNVKNAAQIRTWLSESGWASADLVGHSMGGLSLRYMLRNLAPTIPVHAYVSLGTPQYGVYGACFLSASNGGQMCPSSSFLTALNRRDDTPGLTAWATIFSTGDEVVPYTRSKLDGGACHFQVVGVTHDGLLHSPTVVFPLVSAALDDPADKTCPTGGAWRT